MFISDVTHAERQGDPLSLSRRLSRDQKKQRRAILDEFWLRRREEHQALSVRVREQQVVSRQLEKRKKTKKQATVNYRNLC